MPVPIGPSGRHFDFVQGAFAPNGHAYAAFGEYSGSGTWRLQIADSSDVSDLESWTLTTVDTVPRSGTVGGCSGFPDRHALFGSIVPFDAPSIAVDPTDPNVIYTSFTQHGPGGDESDVVVSVSRDGGATWSAPVPVQSQPGRVEFAPVITVSPDGRISTAFLDADAGGTSFGLSVVFSDIFKPPAQLFVEGVFFIPAMEGSAFWQTDPSFDTHYSDCFGLPPIGAIAPGSGFAFAWADGRDPGPAANDGVDPNIYAATTEGPALSTTLRADLSKTATTLKVGGKVRPRPIPGARVTVTLFANDGGGFDQVGRKRPTTSEANGSWSTSFARPGGGKCRVVVEFTGAVGRAPSVPITKTFAC
jgi:hypothetical protein